MRVTSLKALFAAALGLSLLLVGCGGPDDPNYVDDPANLANTNGETSKATHYDSSNGPSADSQDPVPLVPHGIPTVVNGTGIPPVVGFAAKSSSHR